VQVTLDLDADVTKVSMLGTASAFAAQLQLRQWPFEAFNRDVRVQVTATDSFGNTNSADEVLKGVTRARNDHDIGTVAGVASPAVEDDGTVVIGVAGTANQLRGVDPSGVAAWQTTLEISGGQGQALKAPPSVGGSDIFAGSEDGRVYRVRLDGAIPGGLARWPSTTDTSAVPFNSLYTPIVNVLAADHAYSAGGAAALYQFYSNQSTATLPMANPVQGAGVFAGVNPFFATSDGSAATLRRFADVVLAPTESSAVALLDPGPPAACDKVEVPLAVDASGRVIAACRNGQVHRVANAVPLVDEFLYTFPGGVHPTGSPVVLADGGILVPTSDGNVVKLVPGTPTVVAWSTPIATGGEAIGVAAADAAASAPAIYATTSLGSLVALNADGTVRWSGTLDSGSLGFPTIAPIPAAAPSSALPTLYAGSSTGKLFRVVVDSGLDTTAPWPKAHHDVRNTGSSTSALP
jgi:outer membrane protein assembly factor BamB